MPKKRCEWVSESNSLMLEYHDREWGVPVHNDNKHFEFLILEGAQAGLSWSIVLNKREGYRRAFSELIPTKSRDIPRSASRSYCLIRGSFEIGKRSRRLYATRGRFSRFRRSSEVLMLTRGALSVESRK